MVLGVKRAFCTNLVRVRSGLAEKVGVGGKEGSDSVVDKLGKRGGVQIEARTV